MHRRSAILTGRTVCLLCVELAQGDCRRFHAARTTGNTGENPGRTSRCELPRKGLCRMHPAHTVAALTSSCEGPLDRSIDLRRPWKEHGRQVRRPTLRNGGVRFLGFEATTVNRHCTRMQCDPNDLNADHFHPTFHACMKQPACGEPIAGSSMPGGLSPWRLAQHAAR